MRDGPEIEFELEPQWQQRPEDSRRRFGSLTYVDPAVGGSGFLGRCADELRPVARRTIDHPRMR